MIRRPCDPYLDAGLRYWITKEARKSYWRVAAWIGLDDLIQEGMVVFAMCRQKYSVENKAHFMALVKTCYRRRITDMAAECSKEVATDSSRRSEAGRGSNEWSDNEYEAFCNGRGSLWASCEGDAEVNAALSHAPDEIRRMLALYDDPKTLAELQKPLAKRTDGTRETHSERICRMLGIEYVDMEALLREVLYA